MHLITVPAFHNNYIWILANPEGNCVIVDPGCAQSVLTQLDQHRLTPQAILLTHHHYDHTDGIPALLARYPDLTVFGPEETRSKGAQQIVQHNQQITCCDMTFSVFHVPGHTLGHVAYYCAPYLFCGDTLFSAGCSRLFEGSAQQMYLSLQQIAQLPDETLICCAHEYTLDNATFLLSILPDDELITQFHHQVSEMRLNNIPTIPTTLHKEKKINLFLRCHEIALQKSLNFVGNKVEAWQVFAELRHRKDRF